jgi:putative phosphoribosyl transferase
MDKAADPSAIKHYEVQIESDDSTLDADLFMPENFKAVVVFAHGSGSDRRSPRNLKVAQALNSEGFATLLVDLLTADEQEVDRVTRKFRFDVSLLAERLMDTNRWLYSNIKNKSLRIGFYGASTGAAAALIAAAAQPDLVHAVVSRGGRPDLAGPTLSYVRAPTLLIVGGLDGLVIQLNQQASAQMNASNKLVIVPRAGHLFEEPGSLDTVIGLSNTWFSRYLLQSQEKNTHMGSHLSP